MLSLIQRVTEASVSVDGQTIGGIGPGLLALVAVEPGDDEARIDAWPSACWATGSSPMTRAR